VGGQEITEAQLALLTLRKGQHDMDLVCQALHEHGSILVVPDP